MIQNSMKMFSPSQAIRDVDEFMSSFEQTRQIKNRLQVKESKTVRHKYVGGFWCDRTTGDVLFH